MTIQEMHYDFKIKLDKIDSNRSKNYLPNEIDWLLNNAQLQFVKRQFGNLNVARKGFESSTKRMHDLQSLHVTSPGIQSPLATTRVDDKTFQVDYSNLEFPILYITRVVAYINKACCGVKEVKARIVQHDDLTFGLNDPYNAPSYEFGDVIATVNGSDQSGSIFAYSDGTFDVTQLGISYIKMPARMHIGTYTYIDNQTYPITHCELPDHTHIDIVNLAVQYAQMYSINPQASQMQMGLINNELE